MCKENSLTKTLRVIFKYEFETGYYGMIASEYTETIISHEVARLAKHRKPLDSNKVYTFRRAARNTILKEFDSLDDVIDAINNGFSFGDIFIIGDEYVSIPEFDETGNGVKLRNIGMRC